MIVLVGCYWHRYLYLPVEKPEFYQGVNSRFVSLFHLWVLDEVESCWKEANVWLLLGFQSILLIEPAGSKVDAVFVVSMGHSNCPWLVCHVIQMGLTIRRQKKSYNYITWGHDSQAWRNHAAGFMDCLWNSFDIEWYIRFSQGSLHHLWR